MKFALLPVLSFVCDSPLIRLVPFASCRPLRLVSVCDPNRSLQCSRCFALASLEPVSRLFVDDDDDD